MQSSLETPESVEVLPSSFRDPSGFVFRFDGIVYRQVNRCYAATYDELSGGFFQLLSDKGLMTPHEEADVPAPRPELAHRIIRPRQIEFISYPYEWSFGQLRDAALTTLEIQRVAMEQGFSLKDASAYNIQFLEGRPVLIDTLSFERYEEGRPWVAYRQFCQHFLAPLALMSRRDVRMNKLSQVFIDGIPLDLAGALLPKRTRFSYSLLTHIHLHARSQRHFSDKKVDLKARKVGRLALMGILDSLRSAVRKQSYQPVGTEWGDYYQSTNYSSESSQLKKELVAAYLERSRPASVWDLGANVGAFSRLASGRGIPTVAFDVDPAAVEKNYRRCRSENDKNLLPLLLDLTNPSPDLGWNHRERMSLAGRGPTDMALALALIHHLAISNNVPLVRIAEFFAGICRRLVIEFVPKSDSQVQRLLSTREDVFPDYHREAFEAEFARFFHIEDADPIEGSQRILYRMRRVSS